MLLVAWLVVGFCMGVGELLLVGCCLGLSGGVYALLHRLYV